MKKIIAMCFLMMMSVGSFAAYTTEDFTGKVVALKTCEHDTAQGLTIVKVQKSDGTTMTFYTGAGYQSDYDGDGNRRNIFAALLSARSLDEDITINAATSGSPTVWCGVTVDRWMYGVTLGSF